MFANQLKTVFLLGLLSTVFVSIGYAFKPEMVGVFFVLSLLMNLGAYFFSDTIVLKMNNASPVSESEYPSLHRMVGELSQRAGIPTPKIYLIEDAQPNAFATGRNPAHGVVAVTSGIMRILNERELRGVLAHEIAHIKNRDILIASVAAALASAVTYVAHAMQWMAFAGHRDDEESSSPWARLAFMMLAPLAGTLIQLAISRSREYIADASGAEISGDPNALADALEKLHMGASRIESHAAPATASLYIVNPFSASQFMALFSTHPAMEERVRRLRALRSSWGR